MNNYIFLPALESQEFNETEIIMPVGDSNCYNMIVVMLETF